MDSTFDMITGKGLHDYIAKLVFDPGKSLTRDRKCKKGATNCDKDGKTTKVTIYPEAGAYAIGTVGKNNTIKLPDGSNGYVIAKLVNANDSDKGATEGWLGLEPGDEVYWLIETADDGYAQSRFIQVHQSANGSWVKSWIKDRKVGVLDYYACNHTANTTPAADFDDCTHKRTKGPLADPASVESAWGSCPAGCCTTSNGTRPGRRKRNWKMVSALTSSLLPDDATRSASYSPSHSPQR